MQWQLQLMVASAVLICWARSAAPQVEGSVRLRGGSSPWGGRVEIFTGGQWGVVGAGRWGEEEASVVCRQLGFGGVQVFLDAGHFPPSLPPLITHVECGGWEVEVGECEWGEVVRREDGLHIRSHVDTAAIICADELSTRLSGESGDGVRLVEVWSGGVWKNVCEEEEEEEVGGRGWGREESVVACKQLGFTEDNIATDSILLHGSDHQLWQWGHSCSGSEHHLRSCDPGGSSHVMSPDHTDRSCDPVLQMTNCTSGKAIAVNCGGIQFTPPQALQLINATCSSLTIEWVGPHTESHAHSIAYAVRFRSTNEYNFQWQQLGSHMTGTSATMYDLNASTLYEIQVGVVYEIVGGVSGDGDIASESESVLQYSDTLLAATVPADLPVPDNVSVIGSDSDSVSLTWTATGNCSVAVTAFEIVYYDLNASNSTFFYDIFTGPYPLYNTSLFYTIHGLDPFTWYGVRVRSMGESGNGNGIQVASEFSSTVSAQTSEGVPSLPPPSFSAFLTRLQYSAWFQWYPIPILERNGNITGHTLYCTLHNNATDKPSTNVQLSGTATTYELRDLQPDTQYSCSIAASTSAGEGPHSVPVTFTTPADLQSLPSPPSDVKFTVPPSSSDNSASALSIVATWSVSDCKRDLSCSQSLGFVVTCCTIGSEIRAMIWQSEIGESDTVEVEIPGVRPHTSYVCKVAGFNKYGRGNSGSNGFADTPESAPLTAPTQVYSSDVQIESVRLNWHFEEAPSPGNVVSFKIEIFFKDNRYPNRDGEHVNDIFYNLAETDRESVAFSYFLMYLDPGTEYNFLIRAVTAAGEGPAARIGQQTLSTVPTITPYNFEGSILSYTSSHTPSFYFFWMVRSVDGYLLHDIAGFIVTCSANKTASTAEIHDSNDVITISEPVFIEGALSMEIEFSTSMYFPDTCGSGVDLVVCRVAAFNERGRGRESEAIVLTLPCFSEPKGLLEDSFLTNPYTSLGLLAALVLLVLGVMVAIAVLCVCNSCGTHRKRRNQTGIVSSRSIDESYVPMAPSETGIKSRWSDAHNSEVTAPHPSIVGVVSGEGGDPAYDEIPADRLDNLYDEIHPRGCRVVSTITETSGGGVSHGGMSCSGLSLRSVHTRQQKHDLGNHGTTPLSAAPYLQANPHSIPVLPSVHSTSAARDSTLTQYVEISSPVLGDPAVGFNTIRYSVADSGVNMTSSDVERGLNLDPSLHTVLSQNEGMENVQLRRLPYYTTNITLTDAHHDTPPNPNDNPYYTTMLPYSILEKNRDILEQNGDTQLADEASESGIGLESELSNGATRPNSMRNMEPNQTVVVATQVPVYSEVKKRSGKSKGKQSGGGQRGNRATKEGGHKRDSKVEGGSDSDDKAKEGVIKEDKDEPEGSNKHFEDKNC